MNRRGRAAGAHGRRAPRTARCFVMAGSLSPVTRRQIEAASDFVRVPIDAGAAGARRARTTSRRCVRRGRRTARHGPQRDRAHDAARRRRPRNVAAGPCDSRRRPASSSRGCCRPSDCAASASRAAIRRAGSCAPSTSGACRSSAILRPASRLPRPRRRPGSRRDRDDAQGRPDGAAGPVRAAAHRNLTPPTARHTPGSGWARRGCSFIVVPERRMASMRRVPPGDTPCR